MSTPALIVIPIGDVRIRSTDSVGISPDGFRVVAGNARPLTPAEIAAARTGIEATRAMLREWHEEMERAEKALAHVA